MSRSDTAAAYRRLISPVNCPEQSLVFANSAVSPAYDHRSFPVYTARNPPSFRQAPDLPDPRKDATWKRVVRLVPGVLSGFRVIFDRAVKFRLKKKKKKRSPRIETAAVVTKISRY